MAKITGIKACVFDAYGTLFDIHSPTAKVAAELGDKARPLSDLWRAKQLQYTWLRSLMRTHADFWQVTSDALDYALAANDIKRPGLQERLMQLYLSIEAYPDARACLQALKDTGYATAILSNGAPKMLKAAIDNSGLSDLLDHALSIEDAGIYKPDPSVYRLAVDRLHVTPAQICFVSANAWDAAGAAHFGFQVAHLNRFDQPAERLPGKPAAVIENLADVPGLLG